MKRFVIAALGAGACLIGLALPAGAAVSVHPDSVVGALGDTTGTAGWYTNEFGQSTTEVTATFTLPLTGIGNSTNQGALGGQLCNPNNGDVVDAGAVPTQPATVSTPELYTVGFGWGTLTGDPTTNEDSCVGNTFEANGAFHGLVNNIPAGDSVQVRAQVVTHEFGGHSGDAGVWFYGEDTRGLVNFAQFEQFGSESFNVHGPFAEAAAGISVDPNLLAGPATTALTNFSNITATFNGVTHGLAADNAVSVSSSADAQAPWLITPTLISPSAFVRTWHPGHRLYFGPVGHRTGYRWIKGYWSSTGGGASSFTIDTATKVGL